LAHQKLVPQQIKDDPRDLLVYFEKMEDKENAARIRAEIKSLQGKDDPEHGKVAPRDEQSLAEEVNAQPNPAEEEGGEEFDSAIDGGPDSQTEEG
jgi:hypothetical protein